MAEDFGPDIITLLDDDNNQHEFEIIDEVEYQGETFYALMPTDNNKFRVDDSQYYIFKVVEEDGEEFLDEVEDGEIFNALADIFEDRFNDTFFGEDEE